MSNMMKLRVDPGMIVDSRRATGLRRRSRSTVRRFLPADVSPFDSQTNSKFVCSLPPILEMLLPVTPSLSPRMGARQYDLSGPRLGGTVDAESDRIPSATLMLMVLMKMESS